MKCTKTCCKSAKHKIELCQRRRDHNSIQKRHEAQRIPGVVYYIVYIYNTRIVFAMEPYVDLICFCFLIRNNLSRSIFPSFRFWV